ncbi:Eukaryotic peptide chain release factor subunit 1 [Cyphellophora attinorum]|uniref:Eukaryotic peptide chain release factor subunit 1 n=1 Tax=Cyphellophora attinorum TaxID=1664694 RepID=A0A0N0NK51_9EURO|nr:Eukaryotic peptide chain release factor subunit 1 [Phialophora attinorum]KPI37741.1 Eukaryotic peptide chain release factor subunit 1 [Phialophora attinorum]
MSDNKDGPSEADKNIEMWKIKKLVKKLESARGNGTSMISLIIPPKSQISQVAKMLAEEQGTASNIKSRVNRLSVLSAITSTINRLKLHTKVPKNGLVVFCGEIITSEGKERKLNIDFEPFKPINTSLYLCDNKFHTEALSELLESDQKFGFIIMDGNGALFGTLSGNTREVVHKFSVDLPKKHGRGGQSALRFARLREEKRHNYVRKVAELAVQNFITNDKVNVAGLILAGSADFKNDLNQSDMFDNRLQAKVIKVVDVSYGGENGFNQAIDLSSETLSNVKFIQEKKLINRYFEEISQDSGRICYGIEDTLKALEGSAAETLIVYEDLDITRWTLKDSAGREVILHTNKIQEQDRSKFMDPESGQEMEVVDQMPFLEWLAEHHREQGATLEFVSDRSSEGNQFVKGFGGIGAILRYKLNFEHLHEGEAQRQQPPPDIESSKLSTANRSDDLKASRDDAPRPSQRSFEDAVLSRPAETATIATSTPKPAIGGHAPAASKVQAKALPARLKSRLDLQASEQAGKAPAKQDMELRHGMSLSTILEEDSLMN